MDERDRTDPESRPEATEEAEGPIDEAAVAAFGAWYESQPREWIELMDELGRKGSVASRS